MRHDKSESTHIYDNILYAWFSLSILKKTYMQMIA